MKKFSLTTIPLLCAAITPVCADTMGNKSVKGGQQGQPAMQTTQPMTQITPTANPMVSHWADPYLTADFIWWRAQEDGLSFAYDGASASNSASASRGHVHQPKFKYEPGFKVGFGLKFKHDGWDFYGNYTWLRVDESDTKNSVNIPSGSALLNNYFVMNGGVPSSVSIGRAESKWSMHFNALDLELGRNFWISQWLTLRPHFGMKFSWIDQDYDVDYINVTSGSLAGDNIRLDFDQDQFAVGIRTGLDTAWYLWKKWCIFGEFAISGMWNDFDPSRKDTLITSTTEFTSLHTSYDSHSVTGVLELAIGLRFETAFHNDDYLFMLQAGWEEQLWWNQNQMFSPLTSQAPENLTFEGLTIKAGFDF